MNTVHPRQQNYSQVALHLGLLAIVAIIVFRAPYTESFWLDETISVWVSSDPLNRAPEYKQSTFFHILVWAWKSIVGSEEILLRLPSLLATLISSFFVFRIGRRLCDPLVGALAAIFFVVADSTIVSAVSVRPYAYAQCGFLLCMERLFEFHARRRTVDLTVAFLGFLVAVLCHYLFAAALLPVGACILFVRKSVDRRSGRFLLVMLLLFAIVSVLCTALVVSWSVSGPQLGFASRPGLSSLVLEFFPITYLVYTGVPLVLGSLYNGWSFTLPSRFVLTVLGIWILGAPLLFFLASNVGTTSIWVPRYWSWQIPGLALAYSIVVSSVFRGSRWWVPTCALLAMITFREGSRVWSVESWRELAAAVVEQSGEGQNCSKGLYFVSGLVEARNRDFVENPNNKKYLSVPLFVYGVPSDKVMPIWEDSEFQPDLSVNCLAGAAVLGARTENVVFQGVRSRIQATCINEVRDRKFGIVQLTECVRK